LARSSSGFDGAASAAGLGLARQGFQGTVEQARFDQEMKMISRELAGAMKPVMEVMTKGAKIIRQTLERLDSGGQNVVAGGLVAGAGLSSAWALRSLASGGMAARMLGMGGAGAASAGVGAAEAAAIGASGAGVAGGASRFGRVARVGGPAAAAAALAYEATQSDDYTRLRREGVSKIGSVFGSAVGGLTDLGHTIFGGRNTVNPLDEQRRKSDAEAAARNMGKGEIGASDRRMVALTGGGFEESGSGFERIQNAIAGVGDDAARTDAERRALKESIDKLNETLRAMGGRRLDRPSE
jgi:hypothetical protein